MKLKIGYFADGPWSHKTFEKLIKDKDIEILFICGRNNSKDKILKDYAKLHNIDFLTHKNINSNQFINIIKKYNYDLLVSMSFNQIFKKKIINSSKYKIINCHAGELPFYRGRNILNWVLINDEKKFGISVHYVDENIDSGDIISQKVFKVTDRDNYNTLLNKSYKECASILYDTICKFKKGLVKARKQKSIHPYGSYCPKRKVGDEIINWNQSSRDIFNFVRAICKPGPMARAFINKKEMKINKTEYLKNAPAYKCTIGTILWKSKNHFFVKTKDSFIKIIDYEFDKNIKVGDTFEV
ncbi:methionyl-tRNA formyltransferase [Pelagibacterales bacterium SAG-MED49]|nr:methionyl-tRNA formyltransferase [Pelagibacterales bacterium SAG-MED49]